MDIKFTSNKVDHWAEEIAKNTGRSFIRKGNKCQFELFPDETGNITLYSFEQGLQANVFNGSLNKAATFRYQMGIHQPINIIFCLAGSLTVKMLQKETGVNVGPGEYLFGAASANQSMQKIIHPASEIKYVEINIFRPEYLKRIECESSSLTNPELKAMFSDLKAKHNHILHGNYSYAVEENLNDIFHGPNQQGALIEWFAMESKITEIIADQLHHIENQDQSPLLILNKKDIEAIKKARSILINNLQNAPESKQLARKTGINQDKLRKGFKMIFNKSITYFLQDQRLHKGRHLLSLGEHNVSEVIEMIGYKNQSHFSKIFKQKFGLPPKEFMLKQMQINNKNIRGNHP